MAGASRKSVCRAMTPKTRWPIWTCLILVGHVPIVRSGRAAPDGHKAVSHATDLFYADLGRRWPELSREVEPGVLRYNTLPDLQIDMTVGRIDFEPVARKKPTRELGLLRGYFDKNHHWRNGRLGDLRNAYGQNKNVLAETYALRNLVGPRAVRKGGHHDVGETQPWLFGVDFGDHKGANYAGYANKAVFAINFGSHKHKFDRAGNPMIGRSVTYIGAPSTTATFGKAITAPHSITSRRGGTCFAMRFGSI